MRERRAKAAAVRYDQADDRAPRVLAHGQGMTAERIMEIAKAQGIPLYKDPHLAEALTKLKVGQEIPVELYEVVAQVLAFVYRLDRKRRSGIG